MIHIDLEAGQVTLEERGEKNQYPLGTSEAFSIISKAWLRCGWDNKYVYSFSWLGRPIIQLPEDMFRIQELIFSVQPEVIIETGVAHGGSLVFYASLCKAMGKGRVIGVDIEIRPHNREAIQNHFLSQYITLIEGDSTASDILRKVGSCIEEGDTVMAFLDSCHSKEHVLKELNGYGPLISKDSYIVAMDGIMGELAGAPRSQPDWAWNNPKNAVTEFLAGNKSFARVEPEFPFNEGNINERVTYWPGAFLKRIQ